MISALQLTLETEEASQTLALGEALARLLESGDVLALSGDLGAGKTTFVQGVARGLGVVAPVTSPTFVLISRYLTPDGRVLQHADCYRLQDAAVEMWDAGLDELMSGDDIVIIEWADRIPELLPDERCEVYFEYLDENRRRLTLRAFGSSWAARLASLRAAWTRQAVSREPAGA